MAIVHVVLHKVSSEYTDEFGQQWAAKGDSMLGQIPGLTALKCGTVLDGSKHKAQGWTHMLYSTFEDEKSLRAYADHPVHVELLNMGKGKWSDKMVFDMDM